MNDYLEFEIPHPRSTNVYRVLYNPDAECLTLVQAHDDTDYVEIDIDNIYIDVSVWGTLQPVIEPLEKYLLTQCKILQEIDEDDNTEYDDYVSQHRLTGSQMGV